MKYSLQKTKSDSPVRNRANYPKSAKNGEYSLKEQFSEWDTALPIPRLHFPLSSLIVAFLAVACYGNSIYGGFVFDDSEALENNKDLTSERPITSLFHHDFWGNEIATNESHKSYRPLTILTFRANYYLAGGLDPFSFHLLNVVLHAVVNVLSLRVFGTLMGEDRSGLNQNTTVKCPRASVLCAILFAVHPIHTESVAALVGRADLLCALFFFFPFFATCQLVKMGVCCVYDLLFVGGLSPHVFSRYLRKSSNPFLVLKHHGVHWPAPMFIRHAILCGTGIILLAFRYIIMGSSPPQFTPVDNPASFANSSITRFVNYNYIFAINGWLLLNPMSLCFDWSMGCIPLIQSWMDPRLLVVFVFWSLLAALLFRCAVDESLQTRTLSMALAVLVITFLPATNLFFRVGFVIAERNLYLPSMGYIILVVMGANEIAKHCQSRGKMFMQLSLLTVVICFMGKSVHRSYQWSLEEELYSSGLQVCPLNAKVHYNIAKSAADRGREKEAIIRYRQAIRLHPKYDHALNNLANLLKEEKDISEAENLLHRALHINPAFPAAWMNLGIVQASLKKYAEAQESYEEALKHRAKYPDCYFNLGNLFLDQGDYHKAATNWRRAVELKPGHVGGWRNIITLLSEKGQLDAAIDVANEALRHIPDEPGIYFLLGNVLGKADKFKEAEKSFLKALDYEPDSSSYHANIGVLYHRWNKLTKAEVHYNKALEGNPYDRTTLDNLNKLKRVRKQQGKP